MHDATHYLTAAPTPDAALLLARADYLAVKYQLLLARAIRNARLVTPQPQA